MSDFDKLKKLSKLPYLLIVGSSISFLILLPTVLLLLVGMGLDAFLHKSPVFAISGALVGFLSSFYNIYRLLKKLT
jgi:F0F1-type ATP synthase assembly protein I